MGRRSFRVRRALSLASGLWRAVLLGLLGLAGFILGSALSYKRVVIPFFTAISLAAQRSLGGVMGASDVAVAVHVLGLVLMLVGALGLFLAGRAAVNHVVETFMPDLREGKVDTYRRRVQLAAGPRIVAIGGGTGLSTLLRGLKQHTANITAIVTVTDDGGSSGQLVREKGIIPPGDIRNCLVALADADKAMGDLFQHRFGPGSGALSGHSMGNLLIAALADQAEGDFERAVEIAGQVLAIRGDVVPCTLDRVGLVARFDDGEAVAGESAIVARRRPIREIFLDSPGVVANPAALAAIAEADLIVMGPGSVYTSVIPNLLVPGVKQALEASKAPKVYVCNVMTQPGETDGMAASEHCTAIFRAVEGKPFDHVIVNTGVPRSDVLERYAALGQTLVEADFDRLRALSLRVLPGDTMSQSDLARHDAMKVASRLIGLLKS